MPTGDLLLVDLDPLRLVAINGKNGQVRSQLMYL